MSVNQWNIKRLDLNLFRVLDAIYTNGGISGAARALHLTQPAITHSLNRLREVFDDPLFVRQGNKMIPTEKTRLVLPQVQLCLQGLNATVMHEQEFNLREAELTFTLGFRDVLEATVLPALTKIIQTAAPRMTIISRRVVREEIEKELSAGRVDLVVERRIHVEKRVKSTYLGDETMVVVMAKNHPLVSGNLQKNDYLRARHVVVAQQGARESLDTLLNEAGHFREVSIVCQHLYAACNVVASSNLLLTMPSLYARDLTRVLPIVVRPLPIRLKPIRLEMYWHEMKENDSGHAWLRTTLADLIPGKPENSPPER
ncbi:LysR family transcriptional regulator [Noviherbaspirillum aerium]|uniref:LysR family transcriptional regulator n=1 Tax=Noviherbaspirillum aerium TaxID=2588497 RepID=UPI00124EA646|nr:LysR family transcriptional regulator [Noviherbaspirillum aerium]